MTETNNMITCGALDINTGEFISGNPDGSIPTREELQNRLDKEYDSLPWYKKLFLKRKKYQPKILEEKEIWEEPKYAFKFPILIEVTRYGQKIYNHSAQDVEVYAQKNKFSENVRYFCFKRDGSRLFLNKASFSGEVRAIDGVKVSDHFLGKLV